MIMTFGEQQEERREITRQVRQQVKLFGNNGQFLFRCILSILITNRLIGHAYTMDKN